jgi:hypothetical protein
MRELYPPPPVVAKSCGCKGTQGFGDTAGPLNFRKMNYRITLQDYFTLIVQDGRSYGIMFYNVKRD